MLFVEGKVHGSDNIQYAEGLSWFDAVQLFDLTWGSTLAPGSRASGVYALRIYLLRWDMSWFVIAGSYTYYHPSNGLYLGLYRIVYNTVGWRQGYMSLAWIGCQSSITVRYTISFLEEGLSCA